MLESNLIYTRMYDLCILTALRGGAWFVDNIVILFIGLVVHVLILYLWTIVFGEAAISVNMLIMFISQCTTKLVYLVSLEMRYGYTFGKWLFGLRVVDRITGVKPGIYKVLSRTLLSGLHYITYGFSLVFIVLNKRNLQMHDFISGTKVERLNAIDNP